MRKLLEQNFKKVIIDIFLVNVLPKIVNPEFVSRIWKIQRKEIKRYITKILN